MEQKILEIIKKIDLSDILKSKKNLVDLGVVSKLIIKNNQVIFAIEAGDLGIGKNEAESLEKRLKEEIKKAVNLEAKIIITASENLRKESIKNNEKQNPEQSFNPENPPVPGVKKVIAVASGKGGVGKSTIAVNLAISLKKIGFKVGLIDADIYGPSIAHMMNLEGKPEIENGFMVPIKSFGIDCISVGSLIEADAAAIWRGPMITKILHQLVRGSKWDDIDYLIIDFPPGTGDVHLSMAQKFPIDGALIVSTPSEVATIDVVKSIDMFKKLNVKIVGVVQNMAYLLDENGHKNYLFGQDGAKKMAEKLKLNFLGDIPLDQKIRESGDKKEPVTYSNPSSEISFLYGKIAEEVRDLV